MQYSARMYSLAKAILLVQRSTSLNVFFFNLAMS